MDRIRNCWSNRNRAAYNLPQVKVLNIKVLITAFMILLTFIATSAIIVWILLLIDVIIAGSLQVLLLILMPIVAAAFAVGIWSIKALNRIDKRIEK